MLVHELHPIRLRLRLEVVAGDPLRGVRSEEVFESCRVHPPDHSDARSRRQGAPSHPSSILMDMGSNHDAQRRRHIRRGRMAPNHARCRDAAIDHPARIAASGRRASDQLGNIAAMTPPPGGDEAFESPVGTTSGVSGFVAVWSLLALVVAASLGAIVVAARIPSPFEMADALLEGLMGTSADLLARSLGGTG